MNAIRLFFLGAMATAIAPIALAMGHSAPAVNWFQRVFFIVLPVIASFLFQGLGHRRLRNLMYATVGLPFLWAILRVASMGGWTWEHLLGHHEETAPVVGAILMVSLLYVAWQHARGAKRPLTLS